MKKALENARLLCDGMLGQNYWFNGCMDYLMECLGEARDYDYCFFSGVTGDSFTQIYSKNPYCSTLCLTDRLLANVIEKAFDACGYSFDFITGMQKTVPIIMNAFAIILTVEFRLSLNQSYRLL